jgi:hypothetical protein
MAKVDLIDEGATWFSIKLVDLRGKLESPSFSYFSLVVLLGIKMPSI